MNNKALAVGLVIFVLLVAALVTRNGDIAWMILPFLAYLGVAILQTPARENVRLSAKRTLQQTRSNGIRAVEVRLGIQNQSAGPVCIAIHETAQVGMKIVAGGLGRSAALDPGESADLSYTFTAARGNFSWKTVRSVVSDPLGLVETELLLPADGLIQVRPQIKKFKAIPFRPHSTLHSPGSIPARFGGSGTDFFGVRAYQPGDSLRRLDWRLAARHPRKFFTREFEQEEIADIGLILDGRQDSEIRIGEESLFESSIGASASLAEMFLHQGHRVSLLVFGEKILNTFPGYGKQQLHRILGCLSRVQIGTENLAHVSPDFLPLWMFPPHALLVIISSHSSDDRSFFLRLRASGYQAMLISPDPLSFAAPALARDQDIANRLAIRVARLERRYQLQKIAQLHIPVIDWQVNQPLFPMLRNALARSRGQREK